MKHETTHMERTVKCYGCDRKFQAFSQMILHLETGSCQSDLTSQGLNKMVVRCYEACNYINEKFRTDKRAGEDLRASYTDMVMPFQCPKCNRGFRALSGLLQHSSSQKCSQTLDSGTIRKLVNWLNKK